VYHHTCRSLANTRDGDFIPSTVTLACYVSFFCYLLTEWANYDVKLWLYPRNRGPSLPVYIVHIMVGSIEEIVVQVFPCILFTLCQTLYRIAVVSRRCKKSSVLFVGGVG